MYMVDIAKGLSFSECFEHIKIQEYLVILDILRLQPTLMAIGHYSAASRSLQTSVQVFECFEQAGRMETRNDTWQALQMGGWTPNNAVVQSLPV